MLSWHTVKTPDGHVMQGVLRSSCGRFQISHWTTHGVERATLWERDTEGTRNGAAQHIRDGKVEELKAHAETLGDGAAQGESPSP
jgi:hypothetical protein